jgi:PilZ domain
VSSNKDVQENSGRTKEHRDFPRLHVEAKVCIADTATDESGVDQPAIVSDLSLGGARLSTPAILKKNADIGIIPFSGLLENHPLHRTLEFQVVWVGPVRKEDDGGTAWREYGLLHQGSVLDVLNSWLGHLLLRTSGDDENAVERPHQRHVVFQEDHSLPIKATLSHNNSEFDLTLLDIAPGGLLARGETDEIPVGVHLELTSDWHDTGSQHDLTSIQGCVVDAHSHAGSTFYRVAFDPDSELDDDNLVNWAQSVGGDFDL